MWCSLHFLIVGFFLAHAEAVQVGHCSGSECCTSETLFKVEKFEMVIFEAPEKVTQVVTYDNEAGLKFVDVPKHRYLMKTRHVTDLEDDRLTLQVYEEAKTCMVGKPRHHLKPQQEKQVLCGFTEEFNSQHMFSSTNSVHQELMYLPTALITHNELPSKLRPHCPPSYIVQTFKWINKNEQVVTENKAGDMIVLDPEIQRDYKNGDFLDMDEEKMPEGLSNITRVKRGPRCLRLTDNGQLGYSGCAWVRFNCRSGNGCPSTHVYYSCTNNLVDPNNPTGPRLRGCEYILLCSTVNDDRCAVHSESTAVRCEQCCISDNCGQNMQKCSTALGEVDPRTRKLTLKVNLRRLEKHIGDYQEKNGIQQGAYISLKYNNKECVTSILPTSVPWMCEDPDSTECKTSMYQTVFLNTQGVLGNCWNLDISRGEYTMTMKLKLPFNSPIVVSKVQVIDENRRSRCWASYWKNGRENHNQQDNNWVMGETYMQTRGININDNFNDECTM